MKLSDYLTERGISVSDFATTIGVSHASVSRYVGGTRRPEWGILGKISTATNGAVNANDFVEAA